jgi:hypothetical protein
VAGGGKEQAGVGEAGQRVGAGLGAVALLAYPLVPLSAEGWFLWGFMMAMVAFGQLLWHYRDA